MSSKHIVQKFITDECTNCRFYYSCCIGHDEFLLKTDDFINGERVLVSEPVVHYVECCLLQFANIATRITLDPSGKYTPITKCHILPSAVCPRCKDDDDYDVFQQPDYMYYMYSRIAADKKFTEEVDLYKAKDNKCIDMYIDDVMRRAEAYFLTHMHRDIYNHKPRSKVEFEL